MGQTHAPAKPVSGSPQRPYTVYRFGSHWQAPIQSFKHEDMQNPAKQSLLNIS